MGETVAKRAVVALGGNAITRSTDDGSVHQDYANLRQSLSGIVELVKRGHQVILTHGNGPQVGNQMIRVEMARGQAPDLPLDVVVADLQGGLGYMIERVLRNRLLEAHLAKPVCALLTLVEVQENDPAMEDPTKFVGPAFKKEEIDLLKEQRHWIIKEDPKRGWRRVVPSPEPQRIIEKDLINALINADALVIVTGGGGIPVARNEQGFLKGVEAVVDKDLASSVLAREINAQELYILTDVEQVLIHFGTPQETPVSEMNISQARAYRDQGHFPAGSMGPKVEAACRFVESGGERALITDIFTLIDALDGKTGTWIVPD